MRPNSISRRRFLSGLLLAAPLAVWADAFKLEPDWVAIRHVRLGAGGHRLAHFSGLHHKGDAGYLRRVVNQINALKPDFACFTGDLVEEKKFLPETLAILAEIQVPLFGVPGNHDFWSHIDFAEVRRCFAATGGAWLVDEHREFAGGKINIIGISCKYVTEPLAPVTPGARNILLLHYPAQAKHLGRQKFDLLLAGHSHGGQVRLPFIGALFLPSRVDEYDLGLFQTPAGPMYVNPGIGYIGTASYRFNCRPEITLLEI